MRTLKCPCGETIECENYGGQVTKIKEATGFFYVMTHDGNSVWLCPICYTEAHHFALQINSIVKNEMLYFPSLL